MARIGVWKTLSGAAFLTPDALGFGYYGDEELGKLQTDLERGLSPNKAAGFSGNVYPLDRLRKVEVQERRKRVIVEFRDIILSGKDDFNFHTASACQEFCDVLLDNLGPGWERRPAPKRNFWLTALPIVALVIVVFFLAVSVSLLLSGPDPVTLKDGKIQTQAERFQGGLVCGGVSLGSLLVVVGWLWLIIKNPTMVDAIQKRKG